MVRQGNESKGPQGYGVPVMATLKSGDLTKTTQEKGKTMDKEIKTKWTEALRSGEYEQGRHRLFKGGKFCCLGVLTDVYCGETGKAWEDVAHEGQHYLPQEVCDWAMFDANEMADREGEGNDIYLIDSFERSREMGYQGSIHASTINDRSGMLFFDEKPLDFTDIANLIEENL